MNRTTLGIFIGLALGAVLVFGNFGDMLIVAVCGAVGFAVAKALDGELDLAQFVSTRNQR